jgi:uroporphyrinogen-III synthase
VSTARESAGAPRVLVPRPAGRGQHLADLLSRAGLTPVLAPLIALEPPDPGSEDAATMQQALGELADGAFDLLVVTSPAGARSVADSRPQDTPAGTSRVPATTRVVAVGPTTARTLAEAGIAVDLVADGSGRALVDALPPAPAAGSRVLLPVSAAAAPTVREGLESAGYTVRQVAAYRPVPVDPAPEVREDLRAGTIAAMVLTSSMIARRAAALAPHPATRVVVIGAPTARAARAAGLEVHAVADSPDDDSLAHAVIQVLTT